MASAPPSYTAIALSDDDPQLDADLSINNDDFTHIEDDDDLSLDGLEENDNNPLSYYTGILCTVSSRMQWRFEILNFPLSGLPQKASLFETWKKLSHLWFNLCCPTWIITYLPRSWWVYI